MILLLYYLSPTLTVNYVRAGTLSALIPALPLHSNALPGCMCPLSLGNMASLTRDVRDI